MKRSKHKHTGRTVHKQVRIEVPPDAVYEAWADPDKISQWFPDRVEGRATAGKVVMWHFDTFDYHFPVPVLEAEPGVLLTFGVDLQQAQASNLPPFLQEIVLERDGGHTILRLWNSGFLDGPEWDEQFEGVDSGWSMALAVLTYWLQHRPTHKRTHLSAMRPVNYAADRLRTLQRSATGLAQWLVAPSSPGPADVVLGQDMHLEVLGAGPLTGTVLACTDTEVLLEWQEQHAVLGLKAFTKGTQRFVALDLHAWPLQPNSTASMQHTLDQATERLAALLQPGC